MGLPTYAVSIVPTTAQTSDGLLPESARIASPGYAAALMPSLQVSPSWRRITGPIGPEPAAQTDSPPAPQTALYTIDGSKGTLSLHSSPSQCRRRSPAAQTSPTALPQTADREPSSAGDIDMRLQLTPFQRAIDAPSPTGSPTANTFPSSSVHRSFTRLRPIG